MAEQGRVRELIEQARRNEEILHRMDKVEEFLHQHRPLPEFLQELAQCVADLYGLERVCLVLASDNQRLREALEGEEAAGWPHWLAQNEAQLLLGDLGRPFLTNDLGPEMLDSFFGQGPAPASAAITPLWARAEWLGALCLGSADAGRYTPDLEVSLLERLGRKVALGLEATLLRCENERMGRRQAAMEMAGAACHELSQPLTIINLHLEKLRRGLGEGHPALSQVEALEAEMERLGGLVKNISGVKDYVTRPYALDLRIIDLERAGGRGPRPVDRRKR